MDVMLHSWRLYYSPQKRDRMCEKQSENLSAQSYVVGRRLGERVPWVAGPKYPKFTREYNIEHCHFV